MSRTYANQFDSSYVVPHRILALAEAGKLVDTSWSNDVCPSFSPADGVRLWVEHPDKARREFATPRYIISLYDEHEQWLHDAVRTDDLAEVLAYLADHHDI